jgi:hypothetical protein
VEYLWEDRDRAIVEFHPHHTVEQLKEYASWAVKFCKAIMLTIHLQTPFFDQHRKARLNSALGCVIAGATLRQSRSPREDFGGNQTTFLFQTYNRSIAMPLRLSSGLTLSAYRSTRFASSKVQQMTESESQNKYTWSILTHTEHSCEWSI